MKKLKMTLLTCICLCFCLMGGTIFIACNQEPEEEINPYIKVSGISTACVVGDELDYSNAKILYYENLTDETPEEIALTRDMITDFSSDEAGTSTLTVTYKTLETKMDYSVITEDKFKEIITNAKTKLFSTSNAQFNKTVSSQYGKEKIEENTSILIKDLNIYKTITGSAMGDTKDWYILDLSISDDWRNYSVYDATDLGIEMGAADYNKMQIVNDYVPSEIIKESMSNGIADLYLSNGLDRVLNYSYTKFSNKEIINLEFMYEGSFSVYTIEINNSKITKITTQTDMYNYNDELTISYDVANEEIPAIPENVEFEVENAQFVDVYNTARDTIINSTELTATRVYDGKTMNIFVGNNTIYNYILNVEKNWKQKDGEIWYDYKYDMIKGEYTKQQCSNQTGLITEENITLFLPQSAPMSEEALQGGTITWKKVNGKEVYYCDFMESSNHSIKWTFENGLLVEFKLIVPADYPENTEFEISASMVINYTVNLTNIQVLPNVSWTEVTE